jgi:hypothetical protein
MQWQNLKAILVYSKDDVGRILGDGGYEQYGSYLIYMQLFNRILCSDDTVPIRVVALSKALNVFARSNAGIVSSNPTQFCHNVVITPPYMNF